ncbi:Telomerase holoenzyme Est3 subunit [Macrophomina phaseolina MS6]|uniref:Telomerase holoenzyme Est3 subunit n=1 Tax=Macrophomina phaseolina (strain MS6) TaxID=1126212 RepID=K2RS09_MACPH|nr:Telomerase holoenzyme Est3 subunit [Macrophomina phaseolina MS6]
MSGGLRPWLGERLESELETAVDYWAEGADTRANNPSSQQLEEVFENDGSNLRLKVYMSAIERPLAQIVKFTQVQEDAPIEAIISDRKNSIKARFSGKVAADFENKAKRPITFKTEGGILSITQFELVIPIWSTIDEDPIYILLILADIKGPGGSPIHDEPSPVQRRPKMERLLNQLHNVKSEDPEEVGMDDLAMRSDDDMLSQGAPEEEAYSQFGTQTPFSQLPVLKRSNSQVETRTKRGQSPTVESPRLADQGRDQEPQLILELLRSRTRPTTAADKSLMPPPAPPRTVSQTTQSVRSHSLSRSQSPDVGPQKAEKGIDQNECILVADNSPGESDEGEPVLGVGEDGTKQVNEQGGRTEAVKADSPIDKIDFEGAGPTVDIPPMPDSRNIDTIPTSYQIPTASSSNVPTTNSSIPSIIPTIENDIPHEAPRNRRGPFIRHTQWNCILPVSRSVCRIPQDQENILKKSNSILPSPIGQSFPMGNVPSAILTDLLALAKNRHCQATGVREQGQGHVDEDNRSSGWILRPSPPRELPDSSGDILSTQPPPATPPSWSSSPVQPKQRFADLPPDSSFSEAQGLSGMSRSGRDQDQAGLRHDGIEPSSSPPLAPLSSKIREDVNDEDSDLEMSIPRPLSDIKASQSRLVSKRPQVQPHALSSQPGGPKTSMLRQISSSGASYTHLHLSETPSRTTSSDSRPRRSSTEVRQSSPRKERYITHSSAPVIPCSYEIAREPHKKAPETVTAFDGAAESKMPVFPDNENALVERQIRNEMGSECSEQLSRIAASERGHREAKSPSAKTSSPGPRSSFSANSSSTPHSEGLSSKREAHSPPSDLNRKRVKKISSRYHFSQDEHLPHMSQTPSKFFREQRRKFFQDGIGARDIPLSHRRSASSSHASSTSRSVSPPSSQLRARDQQVTGQGQQSPNNCEQGRPHISQEPSGSVPGPLASLHEEPKLSQASSPSNSDEQILDFDHAPLPITDTDKVSQTICHDAIGVDERFQVARVDSAPQPTANALSTSAKEYTGVVEETVLPVHSESFRKEAHNAPNTSTGITLDREISTPKRSLANAKQGQAGDQSGTPVRDSTGCEILVTGSEQALQSKNSGSRRTFSVAQADPVGSTSAVPNTDEIFAQFCRAYPEYTGTRKHFENLCGTLDKLVRNSKGGFHPFLWDDYIARNWTEYKPYTEECLKEGIQFLHWDDYYFERVRRPKFTEEVVNEDTLAKVLARQNNRERPTPLRKASGLGHGREKTSTPNVTAGRSNGRFSRTGDYGRPEHSKKQQERQPQSPNPTGSNRILVEPRPTSRQQQQGSLGSPIQQHLRHPSPPPAAAATSPPSAVPRTTQPPASTHALLRKLPPPAPGSAFKQKNTNSTGASPSPPPPRARAQSRIPTASNQQAGPPSSSSAAPQVKRPRPPGISVPPPPAKRLETSTTAPPPSALATTAARPQTKERTLSGMPTPPPRTTPARQVEKNMFSLFKQRYYNRRHSGSDRGEDGASRSSRAGSTV